MSTLLTPNDVKTARFTTHRFKEGYDIDEVDSFLDGVHESINALADMLLTLRGSCDDLRQVAGYWQDKYLTLKEASDAGGSD